MARWNPLPFVGGAYTDDATPWTSQDCVNYIPVMAERGGARSPAMLRQAPGCRLFTADGVASPVRGMHNAEGLLVAVKGQTLYSFDSDGAATSLGTIPGVKRCSIAHNQITSGNQIAVANGSSGYVYNTVTGALAQITDEGFPGAKVFDFVDQYIVGVEPLGRYWFHSDLSDATSYNTLDRYEAETAPDKIVTLIATHGEVFVLGERSSEFFYNTGAATGTFQRRDAGMEVGCAAQFSAVRIDNTVVWLGHDGSVYRLNGYSPQRISTHAIEQAIARCNMADAYAYVYEDRGHKIYYLTFADGQTWGYDMATGEWHRRKSYGLDFWRMSHLVRWNGGWVSGDYTNGNIYLLDWRRNDDAGEPLERIRTLAPIHDNGNRLIVNAIKIELDAGKTSASGPFADEPSAPSISGDLPDGGLGDSGTLQYVVTGGVLPYTDITVMSGSLPPGATMDADGLVTYDYTVPGSYSWTVGGTDALGQDFILADTAEVASPTWLLAASAGSSDVLKVSPDGDDWSAAGVSVPLTGGTSWGPTGIGAIAHYSGRVLGVSASAGGGSDAYAFRGDDNTWRKATLNAGTGSLQTLWAGTHWWVAKHSGSCDVSTDGLTFTATGVVAHAIANATGGKVLTAYASGAALGRIEFRLRNADGTDSGTSVPNFDGAYVRGDARMDSDGGANFCIAVRRGSVNPFSVHILGSNDTGQTWTDYGTPFPTYTTSPDGANRHVHYSSGLGKWFVFQGTQVAMGDTIASIALDPVTFPYNVRGVADDGGKLVCCGESGMLYKWTEAGGWEALTSGTTATLMDLTPVSEWP